MRAPKLVLELFREKFAGLAEEIDAGFGFDMVRLAVLAAAARSGRQIDLAGDCFGEADLDQLIDRIGARLGPARSAGSRRRTAISPNGRPCSRAR